MASAEPAPQAALVTGASQGLGAHIAVRLAARGTAVALLARNEEGLEATRSRIAAAGGTAIVTPADVASTAAVDAAVASAVQALGGLDAVAHAVGIAGETRPLWELDDDGLAATLDVNVTGTVRVCRAAMPHLIAAGGGSVVILGSGTGKRPMPGRVPYAASKTALIGLTRSFALDAGRHGVRVNLVSPGPVAGARLDGVIATQAEASGRSPDDVRADFTGATPLGRLTTPDDVADTVLHLLSPRAAGITGEDVNVSSGWVMY